MLVSKIEAATGDEDGDDDKPTVVVAEGDDVELSIGGEEGDDVNLTVGGEDEY